jgi:four helix bundle protein
MYDLEERSLKFAKAVRLYTKKLPRTIENIEDIRQITRSSASVGANYIEANESLGVRDKIMKIKISRKESKESRYFAHLLDSGGNQLLENERERLIQEATELMNIFGAILKKLDKD